MFIQAVSNGRLMDVYWRKVIRDNFLILVRENWKKKQKWIPLYVLSANSIELSAETQLEIIQLRRFELHRKKLIQMTALLCYNPTTYVFQKEGGRRDFSVRQ